MKTHFSVPLFCAADWVDLGTLVLATVAVVLSWLAYRASARQAVAAEGQLKIATSARLYIEGVTAVNFEARLEPVFVLRVGNAGPIQAEDVGVFIEIKHILGKTKNNAEWKAMLIPANDSRSYYLRSNLVLPQDIREVDRWDLTVSGSVTHKGERTPFCFKYSQWDGKRPALVPMFVDCNHGIRKLVAATGGNQRSSSEA